MFGSSYHARCCVGAVETFWMSSYAFGMEEGTAQIVFRQIVPVPALTLASRLGSLLTSVCGAAPRCCLFVLSLRSGPEVPSICRESTRFSTTYAACQLAEVLEPFPFVSRWLFGSARAVSSCPQSRSPCTATEKIGIGPRKCIQLLYFLADQRPEAYH